MSVWFKSRLNPWYIWIPSNPNLYSTKIIMKMRWQTIASNVSIRTISPTATPLPKAYDCVAVYIAGRRTSLVVYGWWPQPPTKKVGIPTVRHQPARPIMHFKRKFLIMCCMGAWLLSWAWLSNSQRRSLHGCVKEICLWWRSCLMTPWIII